MTPTRHPSDRLAAPSGPRQGAPEGLAGVAVAATLANALAALGGV